MHLSIKKPSPAFVIACVALFVSLGSGAAYAANTVFSTDIVDGEVKNADLADQSVTTQKLAFNSIGTGRIIDNTLTSADLKGTDIQGGISLGSNSVLNGRCKDFEIGIGGAKAGEVIVLSLRAAVPSGMLLVGSRVPSDGHGTMTVCNMTGGTAPAIVNLPIRVMTFG
jgi:hypothetical protein